MTTTAASELFSNASVRRSSNPVLVPVSMGDIVITSGGSEQCVAYPVHTSVVIAALDFENSVGGMLHYQNPLSSAFKAGPIQASASALNAYADVGIPALIQKMLDAGAKKDKIQAFLIGAAEITENGGPDLAKKNYLAGRKLLWKSNVLIAAEDIGTTNTRSVKLSMADKRLIVRANNQEINLLGEQKEQKDQKDQRDQKTSSTGNTLGSSAGATNTTSSTNTTSNSNFTGNSTGASAERTRIAAQSPVASQVLPAQVISNPIERPTERPTPARSVSSNAMPAFTDTKNAASGAPAGKVHTVGVADIAVSDREQDQIVTHALGSCVAIIVYDPQKKIGGMIHYMLPMSTTNPEKAKNNPAMFADTGIPVLFKRLYDLGAKKENLVVKMAGGAEINDGGMFEIGKRNYITARKMLWKSNILVATEDVGGSVSRTVRLFLTDGRVVMRVNGQDIDL